jgi:ubiquinone/menaquinone biosynthesis C-methylase UbiE
LGPAARDHDWRSYDQVAESYARVRAPQTGAVAADLVSLCEVRPGQRALDVGAGTGVATRAAAEAVAAHGTSVGIDSAVPMLQVAARTPGSARYTAAEAIDLPFADETFDVVLATFTLAGFQKYDTALFDMLRVLKRGGKLGVCTWGPSDDEFTRAWSEVAEQYVTHEMLVDAGERAMPWAERFSDPNQLKDALHESGLRNIRVVKREYRFEISADDYLVGGEVTSSGRFIHQMLGDALWETFRQRTRQVFAERFPPVFNDFKDAVLAVGTKP